MLLENQLLVLAVVGVYQAVSYEVYSTVKSNSSTAEMKTGSRAWAFSTAVDHQVHQWTCLYSHYHTKHRKHIVKKSNVLQTTGCKDRFTYMQGIKIGQRLSIYIFGEVKLLFISRNTVPTGISALSCILENTMYLLITRETVAINKDHPEEV